MITLCVIRLEKCGAIVQDKIDKETQIVLMDFTHAHADKIHKHLQMRLYEARCAPAYVLL